MVESGSDITLAVSFSDFEHAPTLRVLKGRIERLDISADAKSLLVDIAALTLNVGGVVLAFGRKVLAVVFDLVGKFQNVVIGVIIALVLSAVLATVPLLGPAISALLTPLMLAFGVLRGSIEDFKNMAVLREIDSLKQHMAILSAHSAA